MCFLHAINSDRQTRLLNVLGQIAMILGDKRKRFETACYIVLVMGIIFIGIRIFITQSRGTL